MVEEEVTTPVVEEEVKTPEEAQEEAEVKVEASQEEAE